MADLGRLLRFDRCLGNGSYRIFPPETRLSANGQDAPLD